MARGCTRNVTHILISGYTSEAMLDAQWHRLNTQRPDQAWVQELLPDSHHAEHHRHTREPKYGALNGDLAILLGLVAFSCHAGFVERAVKHCLRHVHGEDGGWRTHNRPRHQGCKLVHSLFVVAMSDRLRAGKTRGSC